LEDALDRKEAEALERKENFEAEDKLKFLEEPSLELEALLPTGLRGKKQRTKATKKLVDAIKKQLDEGNITKANELQQELVDLTRTSFASLTDELSSFRDSTVRPFSPSLTSQSSLSATPVSKRKKRRLPETPPSKPKKRLLQETPTQSPLIFSPDISSTPVREGTGRKRPETPKSTTLPTMKVRNFPLTEERGSSPLALEFGTPPRLLEIPQDKRVTELRGELRGDGLRKQLKAAMDDADKGDPKKGLRRIHKIREQIKDPTHRVEKYIGRVASDMNVNI